MKTGIEFDKQIKRLVHDMTDEIGLVQHSIGDVPNPEDHGYSIDDVARGLIVLSRNYPKIDEDGVYQTYLSYIQSAQRTDGLFHNFFEQKNNVWGFREEESFALQDCYGRVMWALAEFTGSKFPVESKKQGEKIFLEHLVIADKLEHNTSKAHTPLGLSEYFSRTGNSPVKKLIEYLANDLALRYNQNRDEDEGWAWFSDKMTYCNAKLPHSMILAGNCLKDKEISRIGSESLNFLITHSFDEKGIFHAIGSRGWFTKGGVAAKYDQQTVEAGDLEACIDALKITGENYYLHFAKKAFSWFLGKNIANEIMLDPNSGGVYDAITPEGINTNQGAESILSYLLAATKIERIV